MTTALRLHEWINTFRDSMSAQLEQVHPSAQCICSEYFSEMHHAAAADDMAEFARLVELVQDRIADELFWAEQVRHAAADPSYVVRYSRG
jgi:hypothetical protein